MRKLLKFLTGRLFWSTVLIVAQVALISYLIYSRAGSDYVVEHVFLGISLVMTMVVISRDENPAFKIGWILIFMLFPLYGGFYYILFGNKKFSSKVSVKLDKFLRRYRNGMRNVHTPDTSPMKELEALDPTLALKAQYITHISGFPVCQYTKVTYYPLGDDWYPEMIKTLTGAKRFILMEFFILDPGEVWDTILEILVRKQQEGVDVRLMYDDLGTIKFVPNHYERILRKRGLKVVAFNPLQPHLNSRMNSRDHRKVLVVDGNVGFTGGVNLADEYVNRKLLYGHWKDTAVRLEGDAVGNLTLMFFQLWGFATGEELDFLPFMPTEHEQGDGFVQPFGDNPLDDKNVAENSYLSLIAVAKRYVWITTPYLALDNEMLTVLRIAAQSGVDVRIIVPHIPDKWYVFAVTRSYYRLLMECGVRIYEYTPGFIHAKTIVSDGKVAIIGTINMDYRTFYLNFENGVAFYHSSVVGDVEQDVKRTLAVSHEVKLDEVRRTSLVRRLFRSLLRLFSPLM
ncbi:MAG: cardiolipin synthase [Sphaerochaetaceae bacterium]|jgi:cardiolipin synthase